MAYNEWVRIIEETGRELYNHVVINAFCTECFPYDMPGAGIIRCEDEKTCICNYCGASYYVLYSEKLAELLEKF